MVKRTYSRLNASTYGQVEATNKRQRPNEASTANQVSTIWSSDASSLRLDSDISEGTEARTSPEPTVPSPTPPSSPPSPGPSELFTPSPKQRSPQLPKLRQPTFSFLKRSKTAPDPLSSTSANAKTNQPQRSSSGPKPKRLTQMTIDLGLRTTTTCAECGMSYTISQPGDAALHKKYHADYAGILDMSKTFLQTTTENTVWTAECSNDRIIQVGRRDKSYKKKTAEKLLEFVESRLGGVGIPVNQLWGQVERSSSEDQTIKYDRYYAFLYVRDQKCIGVLLAERIFEARRVLGDSNTGRTTAEDVPNTSSSITASEWTDPAFVGISRIWTSSFARRTGVGTQLLHTVRENFRPLMPIDKEMIAFSQPTESGARLARRWFGKESGWHVYAE